MFGSEADDKAFSDVLRASGNVYLPQEPIDDGSTFLSGLGNVAAAPSHGVAQAGVELTELATEIAAPALEPVFGDEDVAGAQLRLREITRSMQPQQNENFVAQTTQGLANFGTKIMAGSAAGASIGAVAGLGVGSVPLALAGAAGGAVLTGVSEGYQQYQRLRDENVDKATARKAATLEGAVTAASVALPASLGVRLGTKIATGVAMNVAAGGIERETQSSILERNGYKEMAEMYRWDDGKILLADAILGASFPAFHHLGMKIAGQDLPKVDRESLDAALATYSKAKHDEAVGIPVNGRAVKAHSDAMAKATDQVIIEDRHAELGTLVDDAEFLPKEHSQKAVNDVLAVLKESGLDDLAAENDRIRAELDARGVEAEEPSLGETAVTGRVLDLTDTAIRLGKEDTAITPTGGEIGVRYAVVEADSLMASQLDDGRLNPSYPKELQPRDRTRFTSQQQISSIARDLNPRMVMDNPLSSEGAPIVGGDYAVESGNGRVLAIRKAYAEHPEKADAYKTALKEAGYDIEGMKKPVLVRVRQGEMTPEKRVAFAQESNQRTTAGMSATEQAMTDATRLSDGTLSSYRGGGLKMAQNRDFVRSAIQDVIPQNEQASVFTKDGELSQDAERRISAALLSKAYGDESILRLLTESTDNELTTLGRVLVEIAPSWAKLRDLAKSESISPDTDITGNIVDAARLILRSRREGKPLADYLNTNDMFGDGVSPFTSGLLKALFSNDKMTRFRSFDKLSEMFNYYIEEANKSQAGQNMFGEKAPTPSEILGTAYRKAIGDEQRQPDLLAARDQGTAGRVGEADRGLAGRGREVTFEPDSLAAKAAPTEPRAREVFAGIHDQLKRVGYDDEQSVHNATIITKAFDTFAKRAGLDPRLLWDRYNAQINTAEYAGGDAMMQRSLSKLLGKQDMLWKDLEREQAGETTLTDGARNALKSKIRLVEKQIKALQGDRLYQSSTTFYSALQRGVEGLGQDKADSKQWSGMIRNMQGVKAEEIEWSGVDEWLSSQKGQVSRQEVIDYLRANDLQLNEVVKGESQKQTLSEDEMKEFRSLLKKYDYLGFDTFAQARQAILDDRLWAGRYDVADDDRLFEVASKYRDAMLERKSEDTKFSQWQLEGEKVGYRELLLTLPETKTDIDDAAVERFGLLYSELSGMQKALLQNEMRKQDFRSSHFDEPNIVAHIRFNERTDVDGKRVLFIEEIQSDMHQAGRKNGYKDPKAVEEMKRLGVEEKDLAGKMRSIKDASEGRYMTSDERVEFQKLQALAIKNTNSIIDLNNKGGVSGVPDAPFKTTWPELAFKRALRYAAENGFDRVAWTTGEQQAARYDLSKHIDKVEWKPKSSSNLGEVIAWDKNGKNVFAKTVRPDELPDIIGKDVSDKLLKSDPAYTFGLGIPVHVVEGADLKVGGEGMAGFYDNILPKAVNKLIKKWGGRVGETTLSTPSRKINDKEVLDLARELGSERDQTKDINNRVHSLDITAPIKDAVMGGLPLFQGQSELVRAFLNRGDNREFLVGLTKHKDASSLMHESGHMFLEIFRDLKNEFPDNAYFKNDWAEVENYLGIKGLADGEVIPVAAHEKWARSFEQYLKDGQAPSSALKRAFESFREWFLGIYKSEAALGVKLTPEIKAVFDRMLATDEEIRELRLADNMPDIESNGQEVSPFIATLRANDEIAQADVMEGAYDAASQTLFQTSRAKYVTAANEAAGRELSPQELKGIEDRIKSAYRKLAADNTDDFQNKPERDRIKAASKEAAEGLMAEALKRKQRLLSSLKALSDITEYVEGQVASGQSRFEAVRQTLVFSADSKSKGRSVETGGKVIGAAYKSKLVETLELISPRIFGLFENKNGIKALVFELRGQDSAKIVDAKTAAIAKKAAKAWIDTTDAMRKRFNAAGGEIGKLEDWTVPQHHNQNLVFKAGKKKWIADVLSVIDKEKYVNDDGTPMSEVEIGKFLEKSWLRISTGGAVDAGVSRKGQSAMVARRHAEHRAIHFKNAESLLAYMDVYSGKDFYSTIIGHIDRMATDIALLEAYGANPDNTFNSVLNDYIKAEAERTGREPSKEASKLQHYYDEVAGKRLPVASENLAATFDTIRSLEVASKMGRAVLASLVLDPVNIRITAAFNNIPQVALTRNNLLSLLPKSRMQKKAKLAGLALESFSNGMNRWGIDMLGPRWAAKMGSLTIRASGMAALDNARRTAWGVTMMGSLGDMVKSHKSLDTLNKHDKAVLKSKGITDTDFAVWKLVELEDWGNGNDTMLTLESIFSIDNNKVRESASIFDGKQRDALPTDEEVSVIKQQAAEKLLGHILEEQDMAILVPTSKQRAELSGGMQRGTWRGELWSTFLLFKSFSYSTFGKHVFERGMNLPTGTGRAAYIAAFMAGSFFLGAVKVQIDELLKGRDPKDMTDPRFAAQAFLKGGSLGIYGDFLFNTETQFGTSPIEMMAGPVSATAADFLALTHGNIMQAAQGKETHAGAEAVRFFKNNMPLQNLWYTQAIVDRLIFNQLQEYLSSGYLDRIESRARKQYGQEHFWHLDEPLPYRAPNFARAVGE